VVSSECVRESMDMNKKYQNELWKII